VIITPSGKVIAGSVSSVTPTCKVVSAASWLTAVLGESFISTGWQLTNETSKTLSPIRTHPHRFINSEVLK
jgi:hypothetical protein